MNLYSHYKINFDVTQYHKFSLTEVENMIPFERELYVDMIVEKNEREKQQANGGVPIDAIM